MRRSPIALFTAVLFLATAVAEDLATTPDATAIISRIEREAVQSSALAAVGYSKRLHVLEIEFKNGAIYRYLNVEPAVYCDLMAAPSKARFYDKNVRGKYRSLHMSHRSE